MIGAGTGVAHVEIEKVVVLDQPRGAGFFDWVRDFMRKCGGKDVYFNDGTVVKDAFEGFLGPELERLNSRYKMLLYTNILHRTIVHRKLEVVTTLSCFHVTIRRGHWGLLHTVSSHIM